MLNKKMNNFIKIWKILNILVQKINTSLVPRHFYTLLKYIYNKKITLHLVKLTYFTKLNFFIRVQSVI